MQARTAYRVFHVTFIHLLSGVGGPLSLSKWKHCTRCKTWIWVYNTKAEKPRLYNECGTISHYQLLRIRIFRDLRGYKMVDQSKIEDFTVVT